MNGTGNGIRGISTALIWVRNTSAAHSLGRSAPLRRRAKCSHAFLGCCDWPKPPARTSMPTARPSSTQHDNVADRQRIHLWCAESTRVLPGVADHRLVLVERRVQQHRHAGQFPEIFDQAMIARVSVAIDGLRRPQPSTCTTAGICARFSSRI